MSSSFRRLISSRANAARSTGPKTEAGKRRSSMNALFHGLRAAHNTAARDPETRQEFEAILRGYTRSLRPQNEFELLCIHEMADAACSQRRATGLQRDLTDEQLLDTPALWRYDSLYHYRFHRALDLLLNSRRHRNPASKGAKK